MKWRNEVSEFQLWCNGHTGFPLVDAGMRQLNATGFMPERIRVIAASFLTKYLLIDWRWGEAYFASQLLDYDIASNVCNWQRLFGCGIDSMPYYKFYKPNEQAQKYDSQGLYQQKWLDPNYGEVTKPMIDLKEAKKMA